VLYVIHHIVVKANLFLARGRDPSARAAPIDLKKTGGLYRDACRSLRVLFLIPALSLAGLPPLSGFWAKFTVIKASLDAGHIALAATGLVGRGAHALFHGQDLERGVLESRAGNARRSAMAR
jgi:multicomponent Na+:H+ antiporter subunit D